MTNDWEVGDIVQINPEHDEVFGGHFMVIDELKPWGAQGYFKELRKDGGLAYYRVKFENAVKVGTALWLYGIKAEA